MYIFLMNVNVRELVIVGLCHLKKMAEGNKISHQSLLHLPTPRLEIDKFGWFQTLPLESCEVCSAPHERLV